MPERGSGTDDDRKTVVGLLADPGLPTKVAEGLVRELPDRLSQRVGGRVSWEVRVVSEALALDEHDSIPFLEIARERRPREGWDLMVCMTDLPRRVGTLPVLADLSRVHRAALVSLPAVGWVRLRSRAGETIVHLIAEMTDAAGRRPRSMWRRPSELVSPVRSFSSGEDCVDAYLALSGVRGRVRLLFGMVRDNRPWRLVLNLNSAIATAAGTGAFGVFYSTIWSMAGALSPLRLALISLISVGVMSAWIILHNGLWEHPTGPGARHRAVLYNAATLITIVLGVACMYVVLYGVLLTLALVVIAATILESVLGHPVGPLDYAVLAWLASSLGTVAGALGSGLEDEETVREATFSRRERERRAKKREKEEKNEAADRPPDSTGTQRGP
ncbi:hypothetical protein HDA32_005378 [Spinactinospora alkalitolerans]|uniref:DUF2267 domain-containing protein n=1 Tax=Spinactinospora alkalitolerans TaxID=687207 RepID=A0A852U221_9ACTN|nr:DUF2267 domain-containing protein [Spinactinospora alkalitolerans]NYE50258.1 hypothetical protein [Spinactinospora alkalitolerans]